MYAYAATLMEGEVRLTGGEYGILPVIGGGWRGAGWRDGMNSHPYHHPAGGRAHPVKISRHPAREHGVSGGGGAGRRDGSSRYRIPCDRTLPGHSSLMVRSCALPNHA